MLYRDRQSWMVITIKPLGEAFPRRWQERAGGWISMDTWVYARGLFEKTLDAIGEQMVERDNPKRRKICLELKEHRHGRS